MQIEVLEQKIMKLNQEIGQILDETGYYLENIDDGRGKNCELYEAMFEIMSHLGYVNRMLNKRKRDKPGGLGRA